MITPAVDQLAVAQEGVVRRAQLVRCGLTQGEIAGQLAARRWQQAGSVVLVLHNGPLTYRQRLWAAVLNAGPRATLCGRTAAAEAGLEDWPSPAMHVVVPRGTVVRRLPDVDVYVHESRRLHPDDIHPTRLPPQTRPSRSVIDAATWTLSRRGACGLIAAAVQQGIATPAQLTDEVDGAGRIRHHRLLRAALPISRVARRRYPKSISDGCAVDTGCPSRYGRSYATTRTGSADTWTR